jgi:hypothetical protein
MPPLYTPAAVYSFKEPSVVVIFTFKSMIQEAYGWFGETKNDRATYVADFQSIKVLDGYE